MLPAPVNSEWSPVPYHIGLSFAKFYYRISDRLLVTQIAISNPDICYGLYGLLPLWVILDHIELAMTGSTTDSQLLQLKTALEGGIHNELLALPTENFLD